MGKKRGKKCLFTPAQVRRMREAKAEGTTYPQIAKVYGVAPETIREYVKNGSWGNEGTPKQKA